MTRALLEVSGLDAGYGPIRVLRGVDLELRAGEVVVVLGANGAGKTTLMRAIGGLADIHAGTRHLDGDSMDSFRPFDLARRGIAQVPEGRRLFGSLTVKQNLEVAFYARRRELDAGRRGELLDQVVDLFPALHLRWDQKARTLSGGEQQMLAVARAVVLEPRVMLLDEPSIGLAPKIVDLIFDSIARLRAEKNVSMLLVEQNAEAALDLCDRAYVLQTGRVVASGERDELRGNDIVRSIILGTAGVDG